MQRRMLSLGISVTLLLCIAWGRSLDAQQNDGPFGLRWGMTKEDVETMQIRLCCRQLGKWGARYEVDHRDFKNFPRRLGDEAKIYLYFGHTNKLLRMYIAISKINAQNRYNQINSLIGKRYDLVNKCVQGGRGSCNDYKIYNKYKKDSVDVEVGFKENLTYRDEIFIALTNTKLHELDKDKANPF